MSREFPLLDPTLRESSSGPCAAVSVISFLSCPRSAVSHLYLLLVRAFTRGKAVRGCCAYMRYTIHLVALFAVMRGVLTAIFLLL